VRRTVVVLLLLALAGCGGGDGGEQAAAPKDGVRELANVLDLRADFAADSGKPRLLLLFSPT
jgi:hypothetical protein